MNFHFACDPIRLVLLWIGEWKRYFGLKSRHVPWKRKALLSVPLYGRETNRLVASSKLNQFLKNENLTVEKREEVDLIVHITELELM
jgi:hypothetical protein